MCANRSVCQISGDTTGWRNGFDFSSPGMLHRGGDALSWSQERALPAKETIEQMLKRAQQALDFALTMQQCPKGAWLRCGTEQALGRAAGSSVGLGPVGVAWGGPGKRKAGISEPGLEPVQLCPLEVVGQGRVQQGVLWPCILGRSSRNCVEGAGLDQGPLRSLSE